MPQANLLAHVDVIRQHAGRTTAERRVKVNVHGKFFPGLQPAERADDYEGEAVEFQERRDFRTRRA